MRRKYAILATAALAFVLGASRPVLADGVGKIISVVNQLFGGKPLSVSAPTNGQALVYDSTLGVWKNGSASGATPTIDAVLAAGASSARTLNLTVATGSTAALILGGAYFTPQGGGEVYIGQSAGAYDGLVDTGYVFAGRTSSSASVLTIETGGAMTATSSTKYGAKFADTFRDGGTNSTTVAVGLAVAPVINYTAATRTGHYEALAVGVTESSLPTGTNLLLALRAGASGTTDKFTVDNSGNVVAAGTVTSVARCISLRMSADIPVNAASNPYLMLWNVEEYKSGVTHSTITANSKITIDVTGKYHFSGKVAATCSSGSYHYVMMKVNGTDYREVDLTAQGTTTASRIMISLDVALTAGDYVEFTYSTNDATNQTLYGTTNTFIMMHYLGT